MPVMLSGMGADEIFAGYPRYLAYRHLAPLDARARRSLPRALERRRSGRRAPGRPGRLRGPRRNLWKFMRGPGCRRSSATSPSRATTRRRSSQACSTPEFAAELDDYDPLAGHRALPRAGERRRRAEPAPLPRRQDLPAVSQPRPTPTRWRWPRRSRCACRCSTTSSSRLRRASPRTSSCDGLAPQVHLQAEPGSGACHETSSGAERPASARRSARGSWGISRRSSRDLLSEETIRAAWPRATRPPLRRLRADNAHGPADNSLQLYALLTLELWHRTFLDRTWRFEDIAAAPAPAYRLNVAVRRQSAGSAPGARRATGTATTHTTRSTRPGPLL